jgi:hypothetical protein
MQRIFASVEETHGLEVDHQVLDRQMMKGCADQCIWPKYCHNGYQEELKTGDHQTLGFGEQVLAFARRSSTTEWRWGQHQISLNLRLIEADAL